MDKQTLIFCLVFLLLSIGFPAYALDCKDSSPCPQAIKTLYSQALSGSPNAQILIGNMYREGKFFDQNSKKSFQWFEQASRYEPVIAVPHYEVGISYLLGLGIEKRAYKGIQHLEKAALAGSEIAQLLLASEYLTGHHVELNEEKARSYFLQASKSGDLYANFIYGLMLKLGIGGPKDVTNGNRLIQLASTQKYPAAKHILKQFESATFTLASKKQRLRKLALYETQKILDKVSSSSLNQLNDLDKLSKIAEENARWLKIHKKKPKSLPWYLYEIGFLYKI